MSIYDYFDTRFEDFYANPDVVIIALSLIVFAIVFSALSRGPFKKNRTIAGVISLIVAFSFMLYFRDLTAWIATFNLLLILAIIGIFIIIAIPFFKFLKKQF